MRSIRRHLTLRLLAGIGVLVVAAGAGGYILVGRILTRHFDEGLVQKVSGLALLVEPEIFGVSFASRDELMPEYSRSERPEAFQVWVNDSVLLRRSKSLAGASLPRRAGPRDEPAVFDLELPDGRPARAAGVRFHVAPESVANRADAGALREAAAHLGMGPGGDVTIVCARDTLDLARTMRALAWGLLAAGVVLAVGTFLLVRAVVAAGCRPLTDLAARIDGLTPGQTDESMAAGPGPVELEPFRSGFLRFTRRIHESLEREKRLTGNIAHELRTPIAELRTITELARKWPEDGELRAKSLDDAYDIALQMERLLRTCLRLARLQSGLAEIRNDPVDLSRTLDDLCRQNHEFANGRALKLDRDVPPGCSVRSDQELLELILGNLLDNAFHHAPAGTSVRVRAASRDGGVGIAIENPVEGFGEADLVRAGEPFWRKEDGPTGGRHLGLGLATVKAAARTIGADIEFHVRDGCFAASLQVPGDRP